MQLSYGSYSFDAGAVTVAATAEALLNDAGKPYSSRQRLMVRGYLSCSGQADCTTKMDALKAALVQPYQDLVLVCDDSSTSSTLLRNANSSTGVRIIRGPDFPKNDGAEYATHRYFEFEAEAEYPLSGVSGYLLSFKETITTWGGGPLNDAFPALNGPPQPQTIYLQMPYRASQVGRAVGAYALPTPPGPKWPFALKENPRFGIVSPDPRGANNSYERFEVTWSYEFVSVGPLVGTPNVWVP